jgi:hypothetical protein
MVPPPFVCSSFVESLLDLAISSSKKADEGYLHQCYKLIPFHHGDVRLTSES